MNPSAAVSSQRLGRVITFYSYKGGTGRSMALANVAWILASAGKRVLTIDWDLEAPGLHRYFAPFLEDKELSKTDGLIEFVARFLEESNTPMEGPVSDAANPWYKPFADFGRVATALDFEFLGGGSLEIVGAGRQNSSYSTRVSTFDWRRFYGRGGGTFLNAARHAAVREYDYILIDSRTGVSDTSGICTVELPDYLIVCFTLNNQGTLGASGIVASVASEHEKFRQRLKLLKAGTPDTDQRKGDSDATGYSEADIALIDLREPLRIFPVPMRVDYEGEDDKRKERTVIAQTRFDGLPPEPRFDSKSGWRDRYWFGVEVPHRSFYSYEEILSTFRDSPDDPKSLLATFIRLTGYLTDGDTTSFAPPTSFERADALAKYAGRSAAQTPEERWVDDAESIYADLPPTGQVLMRRLVTRLVFVAPRGGNTRHSTASVRLEDVEECRPVISRLLSAGTIRVTRGMTAGVEVVQLANNELIASWPRLVAWIEEDRAFLEWRQHLGATIDDQDRSTRLFSQSPSPTSPPTTRPFADDQLAEAQKWLVERHDDLSPRERHFIEAAVDDDRRRREASNRQQRERDQYLDDVKRRQQEEERLRKERQRRERRRRIVSGSAAVVIVAATYFGFFSWKARARDRTIQDALLVGSSLADRGQIDSGLVLLRQAAELDSSRADVWAALARLYERQGTPSAALAAWSLAIQAHDSIDFRLSRGALLAQAGTPAQANADIDAVIRRDSRNARAYYLRGVVLSRQADLLPPTSRRPVTDSAVNAFGRAIHNDSTFADAYLGRAALLPDSAAAADYRRVLAVTNDSTKLQTARKHLAGKTTSRPHLYVQFVQPEQRTLADELTKALPDFLGLSWIVDGPELQSEAAATGDVRYFFAGDSVEAALAHKATETLLQKFGVRAPLALHYLPTRASRSERGVIEVWLPRGSNPASKKK